MPATELEKLRSRFPEAADHAVEVFGSPAKTVDWLTSPCGALHGGIPLDLLARGDSEAVDTELGRIEYGIYV